VTEHPTNYSKPLRQLEDAAELLTRLTAAVPLRWAALVDALSGQPGAQDYGGGVGGPGSVVVCDAHDRDIAECQRQDLFCTGHPIPARTDPTAAAAVSGDPAGRDMADFRRASQRVLRDAEVMVRILERYGARPANAYERSLTTVEQIGNEDPGCQSCSRLEVAKGVPRWEPAEQGAKIDGEVVRLCRWCRAWWGTSGTLPSRDVLERHHRGERIKRPA